MKNEFLPFDKEPLSPDALDRIMTSAREKAGLSERTIEMNKTTKRKISKRIIVALTAAVVMCGTAMGAYAIGSRTEMFREYMKGDTSSFDVQLESTVKEVSNDDITLSINGIAADELACRLLVTVEAKTGRGREIIEHLNNPDKHVYPAFNQLLLDQYSGDVKDVPNEGYGLLLAFRYNYPDLNNENEYHLMFEFETNKADLSKPFRLVEQESGLYMDFDIAPYFESFRLYAEEDSKSVCHYVSLSQLGLHIRSTSEDVSGMSMYYNLYKDEELPEIYVNYADGSSIKLENVGGSWSEHDTITESEGITFTGSWLEANPSVDGVPSFLDINDAVSATINGVEYKRR